MFNQEAKFFIENAITAETASAINNWGETYNSLHEGYAILKEEVEEANDEMKFVNAQLEHCLWPSIKSSLNPYTDVANIRNNAERLALEAVQVAAVCNKILNGL